MTTHTVDVSVELSMVGPYHLKELLGEGGMGAVYRAFDERLQRTVAVKRIHTRVAENVDARRRFRREARSAARLNHPAIVRIHDLLEVDGADWIVMELVEGEPLSRILRAGPLPSARALAIAVEIAEALAAAHDEGIIHRDLKGSNVFVTPDGHAKILDFGLAKQISSDNASTTITVEGQILGTPFAMSPEQAMGRRVDFRSDFFSLGVLLYELIGGVSPFQTGNVIETIGRVCLYQPPPLTSRREGVAPQLAHFVDRLLEKEPVHRPQSSGEVVLTLRRLANSALEALGNGTADSSQTVTLSGNAIPSVTESPKASATLGTDPLSFQGERRQVTLLCCDLISRETPSISLDPEAFFEETARFERLALEVIEDRFGGHVSSALGHRVVGYFGYPKATEDTAVRAVRAALEIAAGWKEDGLAVRSGIHTSEAIVIREVDKDRLILGRHLDIAHALLRSVAPGEVWISDTTRPLLKEAFRCRRQEILPESDGLPAGVFNVQKTAEDTEDWWDYIARWPCVGRESEIHLLGACWRRARAGTGQAVLVTGEAGIGKSRLARSFLDELLNEGAKILTAFGSPFAQQSPFRPIVEILGRMWRLDSEATDSENRLARALARNGLARGDNVALMAAFFELSSASHALLNADSQRKLREKTLRLLVEIFEALAREQPLILLVEDLHWVDPSTLEVLLKLIESAAGSRMFLLMTSRPELDVSWPERPYLTRLVLSRLADSAIDHIIDRVTGGRSLPAAVQDQIIAKTDGIPLFVEELTKNLIESERLIEKEEGYELVGRIEDLVIPVTLRDSLAARLDRLGPAKKVAQLAAVVGREISYQFLAELWPERTVALQRELDELVAAEILHRRGFSSRSRYVFKHALLQGAAYESLLARQRRSYHERIAGVIEESFPAIGAAQPELLAHHYRGAERFEQSIENWLEAGRRDIQKSAAVEATDHLRNGLRDLGRSDLEGEERDSRELKLQANLALALSLVQGFAAKEVGETYGKTLEILRETVDIPELHSSLWGVWASHISRADYETALELTERMRSLIRSDERTAQSVASHYSTALTSFGMGQFRLARESIERALETMRADSTATPEVGFDFEVGALSILPCILWPLGELEAAQQASREAVRLARDRSHPATLALALAWAASFGLQMGRPEGTREKSAELIRLSETHGLFWGPMGKTYLGWACVADASRVASSGNRDELTDQLDVGVKLLHESLEEMVQADHRLYRSLPKSAIAEGYALRGQFSEALKILDEALVQSRRTGERFWDSELWRLRGKMLRDRDAEWTAEAIENLEKAQDIARMQGAISLQQRALATLSQED